MTDPPAAAVPPPPPAPPAWDEAPVRAKGAAIAALGVGLGLGVGVVEARLGYQVYPMLIGLTATFALLAWLGQAWLAAPLDRLVRQLELMARHQRPQNLGSLPVARRDEVGRIARSVQVIAKAAVDHHREAKHLRQTMSHGIKVAAARENRQLRVLATRDPLTQLGNRRFLDENLEMLVKVSLASKVDMACLLMDLDKFKDVNDSLGHHAGDQLLSLVGELIRGSVRHDDLSVRLGGDEFVVIMPGAALARVEQFADGLRKLLRQRAKGMFPAGPHANLSIGIASLLADRCETGEALLDAADKRLYEAKRRGRGCTVSIGDDLVARTTIPMAG